MATLYNNETEYNQEDYYPKKHYDWKNTQEKKRYLVVSDHLVQMLLSPSPTRPICHNKVGGEGGTLHCHPWLNVKVCLKIKELKKRCKFDTTSMEFDKNLDGHFRNLIAAEMTGCFGNLIAEWVILNEHKWLITTSS